ncbi:MAG: helix-turn-helix domain-containing protein [Desulfobulbus sp.]
MNEKREIGSRLKWIRERLGMSGAEFGASIGISQSKIADLERGKTKISIELMGLLERKYGISRDWLIEGIGHWERSTLIKKTIQAIEDAEDLLPQMLMEIEAEKLNELGLRTDADVGKDIDRVQTCLKAINDFKSNLDRLHLATKKAETLGLTTDEATRVQEIILGAETGDRGMVERALNNLNTDESLLLKNYRTCSSSGKKALICTSEALNENLKTPQ